MGGDGRPSDGGGGGGAGAGAGHPHQFQYQALLAAVHTQNPNHSHNLPFPLPPLNGPGPDASTHNAVRQPPTPRGFADWSASTSAFTSLAVQSTPSTATANAYHYSLSPCYAFWTHYMLNKNAYSYYPAPNQEHTHPFSLDNNQAKDPGSIPSFGIESFNTTSLAPNMSAHMPPMEGPLPTKEPEAPEDMPARVATIKDEMDARNGVELKCETVDALPELKQGHESCASKDAEASLPPLCERDPVILQMDDMVLPITWKFKYRFWPNNKSRMYILDSTSEFVKTHGLQAGDALIIYKNPVPGKYIVRGEKAIQQTN
ncbi:hypothetical protein CFC21_098364 [Triticum aestivum]|uniref:TF-B3 domain-containing protein n=4 Tax=Triticum TaxID=4564 RepID=A0A9R0ZGH6_TRITD|nr:hypothetical protein CFC21_098364 [Triticum aestivum]VAI76654.1 unnamed protein product [Triticum turgidum subsp. durum]